MTIFTASRFSNNKFVHCKVRLLLAVLLIYIPTSHADSNIHARYTALTKEIRCVVCQGQSIADSNAPLAKDLREKIHQQMLANKTDEEIKTYLASRYGDFILLRPKFNGMTFLLWVFPFASLLAMAIFFYRSFLKR